MVRDKNGRFVGNCAGPGRPPRLVEETLLDAFRSGIAPSDVMDAQEKLQKLWRKGNLRALQIWLEYGVGMPPQQVDLNLWDPMKLAVWLSGSPSGGNTSGDE